jgi:aspartate carbamoyltransferase catalytic subunit
MQKEWLTPDEFIRLKDQYILTRSAVDTMKPGAIIMHALPRVNEIESAVDQSGHSKYFEQAIFGVPVRAALLEYVLGV